MALSLPQLQANLDAINTAIGSAVLSARFPDGRQVTCRTMQELRLAKADIEDEIQKDATVVEGITALIPGAGAQTAVAIERVAFGDLGDEEAMTPDQLAALRPPLRRSYRAEARIVWRPGTYRLRHDT